MKKDIIITISRQFASGGRSIGKKLADALGIPYYDKELITLAARESGYKEEFFENADEKASSKFLYYLSSGLGNVSTWGTDIALDDKLFFIQADVIRSVAAKGSCVIIGRCADYVLDANPNCINIFIYSDLTHRLQRAVNDYHLESKNLEDAIIKSDKKRATYYNYYSDKKWGQMENYDLLLNSDSVGIDNAVKLIKEYVDMRSTAK
ncbi:MAG: cytidylate kinase-like family protein [Christensenellaceae bacterium]